MSQRSSLTLGLLAIVLAVTFARLGLWQLDRRAERVETNSFRESRGAMPLLRLGESTPEAVAPVLSADSVAWRRVRVAGRFDVEREIILRSRSRNGSPGVELLTPLLVGSDPPFAQAILVLRGWLPAADGIRPRASDAWPAASTERTLEQIVDVEGVAVPGTNRTAPPPIRVEIGGRERAVLVSANLEVAQELLPYQIADFYVRSTAAGTAGSGLAPPRELESGEGPHLAYALQWFSFAIIALVGTGIFLRKEHGR